MGFESLRGILFSKRIDNLRKKFANAAFDKRLQEVAMMYAIVHFSSLFDNYFNLIILHL